MAHVSGYDGTISYTAAADAIFGPTDGTTVELESWTLRQTTDTFSAFAKGEAHKTKFATASDWTATVTFLIQDGLVSTELDIRKAATAPKQVTSLQLHTTTQDFFAGEGYVSSIEIDDPLDGPVRVTCEIEGNSAIVSTGAAP